jgi:hypothetical protein
MNASVCSLDGGGGDGGYVMLVGHCSSATDQKKKKPSIHRSDSIAQGRLCDRVNQMMCAGAKVPVDAARKEAGYCVSIQSMY